MHKPFAILLLAFAATSQAADTAPVLHRLKARYPATQFDHVKETPVAGLYEVKLGENIVYITADGRYWLIGAMFDMPNQIDLTAQAQSGKTAEPTVERREVAPRRSATSFDKLPLDKDAIVQVRGRGTRKLAVFSDTECGYCRRLEATLAALDDVTIYTFPVAMLGAPETGISAWCAPNRAAAWNDLMLRRTPPPPASCPNPLKRNEMLAANLGVRGTPIMFNARGEMLAGAQSLEAIQAWLGR